MGKHKSPSRIPPSIAAKIRAQSTSPDPPPRSSPGSDETVPQSKVPANVTASAPPTTSQGHVEPPQEGSVVGTPEVDASASNSKPSSVLPLDTEVNSTAKTSWRDKKSVVPDNSTSDKELTTAQQKRKQKKKEARQRKKAKLAAAKLAATTKDSPRTAKDYLTDPSAS
ncbi:hypothetical protein Rs2_04727 [Raphanus sativus]|nr:hypothetical protein Rs2_04727 [Raphanus sativus]